MTTAAYGNLHLLQNAKCATVANSAELRQFETCGLQKIAKKSKMSSFDSQGVLYLERVLELSLRWRRSPACNAKGVKMSEKNEIIVYQPEGGEFHIEVRVENETVWLTQAQMAELFDVQRQAITKHIKNIFESHELEEKSTSSILELVQKEGNRNVFRKVSLYNLDMIISVGFRETP